MPETSDLNHFARLIEALRPWLDQVVIIGGWAHRLYRLHPHAQPLDYAPLATLDTDVALPLDLPATSEQIRGRLLGANFHEELLGDTQPPAAHYRIQTGGSSFYAEFLTALQGSEVKRGKPDVTARISGVSVQKLRHLELVLANPWEVLIARANGYPTPRPRRIRIPNPAAFLVQKILIHGKRNHLKRAKDLLYIHDTIETFGGNLGAIREEWQSTVRPLLQTRSVRIVEEAPKKYFKVVTDAHRDAARMGVGRTLTPEMVREVCEFGWTQIFSSRILP